MTKHHWVMSLGVSLVLAACGHHNVNPTSSAPDAAVSTSSFPSCDSVHYTIDGYFTGYPSYPTYVDSPVAMASSDPSPAPYEWQSVPHVSGMFTHMYMDGCTASNGNYLFFINDWFRNSEAPVVAKCFNRFDFFNPATSDAVEVRVYGDHRITVLDNGVDVTGSAVGGAGFASSPNVAQPHSIFEFKMFLPGQTTAAAPTTWTVGASDPCGGAPPPPPPPPPNPPLLSEIECEDPAYLLDEPTMAHVTFGGGGVTTEKAPDAPIVMAFDRYDASPGDRVVARGRRLGTTAGTLSVAGQPAQVLLWTDTRIVFVVPAQSPPNAVTQITGSDGWSVPGPLVRGAGSSVK